MTKSSLVIKNFDFRLIISLLLFFFISPVLSTTIARVGSDELVNRSELIFEGLVVAVRPELNEQGYIYTFVEFIVNEVIVGDPDTGTHLTLRFTGGTVEDKRLDVGARIPELNETGIYFVERVQDGLINPLLGWDQGHFVVTSDGTVIAGNSEAVVAVESRSGHDTQSISNGLALGIKTRTRSGRRESQLAPMSAARFKQRIKALKSD